MIIENRDNMREYKIAKGWKIAIYIMAPLMIVLFLWALIYPLIPGFNEDSSGDVYWILAPISVGVICLMVLGLIDAIKGKVVIDEEKIYLISVFSKRQLLFNEIKGYRIDDKYIYIEPNSKDKKRIKISTYIGKSNEIVDWLSLNYSDLDILNSITEEQEILNDEELGWTIGQRESKLNKARKISKILNFLSILILIWTLFIPRPYEFAVITPIIFLLLSLVILKTSNGLIRINEVKGSAYPSIFSVLLLSSMAICLRAMIDFNIFNYHNCWIPSILIAIGLVLLLVFNNKEFNLKKGKDIFTVFALTTFLWCYGFGSLIVINGIFDESIPEFYNAKILSKRISTGKTTSYYFELTPWGPQSKVDEVSVSKDLYNELSKDDKVNIYFKKGLFDIPWFVVTE